MVTLRDQLPDARLIELAGSLHDTDHIEIGPLGRRKQDREAA